MGKNEKEDEKESLKDPKIDNKSAISEKDSSK